jgi:calcium permeable stress-gated cation channel
MAIRLFAIMGFFAATVLWPINSRYVGQAHWWPPPEDDEPSLFASFLPSYLSILTPRYTDGDGGGGNDDRNTNGDTTYLWAYVTFTYFFTFLTIYYMNWETFRIIRIRQDYLGTQSTITDRTFRISGLPKDLRSEDKIKKLIEKLEIGRVDSVTICRNWKELDALMAERTELLTGLEQAWGKHLGKQKHKKKHTEIQHESENGDNSANNGIEEHYGAEADSLLASRNIYDAEQDRPSLRIWYGFLNLRSRKTDAIDYYEEKLRRVDEKIYEARRKPCEAVDLAFVTMDSIAACQMAIQAQLDPRPGQLLTKLAPSPSDVVWANTYSPRGIRRLKSWLITLSVAFLTLIWVLPVATLATLVSICNLEYWFKPLVESLSDHPILRALVQTGLPTVTVSLLNIAVPYLYDYVSARQGMISKSDVELSVISKNFFFAFFNIFIVFAISGTAARTFWLRVYDGLKDTSQFMKFIGTQIRALGIFYVNFIMLQGVGLFPFRLLEVGAVVLYPISRFLAKTPRELAEIDKPPIFTYGLYLPTALLIFILCLVYSVIEYGHLVLFFGLIYFTFGYFTYKYQLLYAMDQPQHATGGAWRIICYRIILGLVAFQVVMSAVMALSQAFFQSVLVAPLLVLTVWYSFYFKRRYEPLTRYISLRSIRVEIAEEDAAAIDDEFGEPRASQGLLRRGSTIDEDKEKGSRFVNPNLVIP